MDAIIVEKSDGSQHRQSIQDLQLGEASVVKLPIAPESVASFEQNGNDLMIVTADGSTIVIGDFFVEFGDERNELVLVDDDGIAWWGQYAGQWSDFAFAEIGADTAGAFPWGALGGLGAASAGGLAFAGGGGEDAAAAVFPALDVEQLADDPVSEHVRVNGNSTGDYVVVSYPDGNGNIVQSEPIPVGEDGSWTYDIPRDGIAEGDVDVTGTVTDAEGNPVPDGDGNPISDTETVALDLTGPDVGVEIIDNGQDGQLVLTFSPDTDRDSFDPASDLDLDNADLGTDGTWSTDADGNQVWTTTITPTGNGEVTATVTDGSYTDTAGNAGSEGSDDETFDVDGPSVVVDIANEGQTGAVTFTFSEAVTGFETGDVTVGNGTLTNLTKVNDTTWTATVTPETTGDVTVSVGNGSYTDLAGNPGTKGADTEPFDRTAPTVGVEIIDNGQDGELVLTFSPDTDRDSFDPASDLDLDNADLGTDGTWSTDADGNQVWTTTITPTGNGAVTATVTDGSYTDTAGNAGSEGSDDETFDVDGPSVVVDIANEGQTGTVTFTFSEAVTGFDAGDVSANNGTLTNLTKVNDTTWTATVTPKTTGDVTVSVGNGSYTDLAGNPGTKGADTEPFDRTAPTVGVEIIDNGQDGELVLTFSPDTDRDSFDPASDLDLDNADLGTDGTWSTDADGNQVWTTTITPTGNGAVTATVTDGSYTDTAGNAGSEGSDDETFDVDGPSVVVDIANEGQTGTVTFTFSEAVTGFDAGDVSANNGTLTNLTKVNDTTWTATVTPKTTGDVTVSVGNGSYTDLAGNPGTKGADTEPFDRTAPTVGVEIIDNGQDGELVLTFSPDTDRDSFDPASDLDLDNADLGTDGTWSTDADGNQVWTTTITPTGNGEVTATVTDGSYTDTAGNAGSEGSDDETFDVDGPSVVVDIANEGQTGAVTFTFSEAVTGFETGDVTVGNGTLTNLTKVNDTTWTATVTPETTGDVTVSVGNGSYTDLAGNPGTKGADTEPFDRTAPTVGVEIIDNGQDGELVLTFSPDTDRDSFDPASDLDLDNADLGTDGTWSTDADGNQVWTTTITPTGNGAVTATVTDGSYTDTAGNAGSEGSDDETFDVDGPSVVVDIANEGQTGTVTFTFSEAVTGFDAGDVSANNGTLTNLTKVNDTTWTATVTPKTTGDVTVSVGNGSYTDLAGNPGTKGADTEPFDRTAPTVGVEIIDNGQDGELVLTFSPDTDRDSFDPASDLDLDNADLGTDGTWSTDADGNQVWTTTITPTGNGAVTATVTDGSYTDTAGNAGSEGSDDETFDVDGPSVVVDIANEGQTGAVTFTFSEAVTGFETGDVTVGNGTLTNLTKVNDTTWTATVTPETTGDVTVSVGNGSYTDLAGNPGTKGADTEPFDRTAPTVGVEIIDNGQDGELVLTFSPDTDRDSFDPASDLDLDNADLGTDGTWSTDADGNQVWTTTITPTGNGAVTATVTDGSYTDTAGNAGSEGSDDETFDVDGPSVVVDIANEGQTGAVTFTFSEAVTGFETGDVTVGNGTLTNLTKVNDTTWTATVTPETTGDVTVSVGNGSYTDLAGNPGTKGADTEPFDRTAPTVGVEIIDNGQDGELVLTFSPDTDRDSFDPATDLDLDNADLGTDGTWSMDADGNQVWTTTITPTGNGEVTATVTDGSYTDTAGNAGSEGSDDETFDVDGPSVVVDIDNQGLTGEVTFTFSEDVNGFDENDVSVSNGTLSDLHKVDGNTWKATVTPEKAGGDVTVSVADKSYTDTVGNLGSDGQDTEVFARNAPLANDDDTTLTLAGDDFKSDENFNLAFVLDFSGSVSNNEAYQMLEAVKAAGQAFFEGTTGDVKIQLVAFSSAATSTDTFSSYADFAAQVNAWESRRPYSGSTNYTAAINETMQSFEPDAGSNNRVFFMSDGEPNRQYEGRSGNIEHSLQSSTEAAWNAYVNTNDIDVQTVGIGQGVTVPRLQDVDEVDGDNHVVQVANFDDLVDDLLDVIKEVDVSGNVLNGDDGIAGTADDDLLGIDGGRILSIDVDGEIYTYDQGKITDSQGDDVTDGAILNVETDQGGRLVFDFETGGWTYTADPQTETGAESFDYVLTDDSGDTSTASLAIDVVSENTPTIVTRAAVNAADDSSDFHVETAFHVETLGLSALDEAPANDNGSRVHVAEDITIDADDLIYEDKAESLDAYLPEEKHAGASADAHDLSDPGTASVDLNELDDHAMMVG